MLQAYFEALRERAKGGYLAAALKGRWKEPGRARDPTAQLGGTPGI